MKNLLLDHQELEAFLMTTKDMLSRTLPSDKHAAIRELSSQIFRHPRNPNEIADRIYCLLMCVDASRSELDIGNIGVYGNQHMMIHYDVIENLWAYFGNPKNQVDLTRPILSSEIPKKNP